MNDGICLQNSTHLRSIADYYSIWIKLLRQSLSIMYRITKRVTYVWIHDGMEFFQVGNRVGFGRLSQSKNE